MEVLRDIFLIGFLAAIVTNLANWNGRRTERWLYVSGRGWFSVALTICGCLAGVATLLWIFRVVPSQVAGVFAFLYFTAVQVYSVWFRRRQRQITV